MSVRIRQTTIDARDAYAQSVFWAGVLGFVEDREDPNEPGHEECAISAVDGSQTILFIEVPEVKSIKNRLHLDLEAVDGTRDSELARMLALGATQVGDLRQPDGSGWVVLADPEGNEFCILRSAAERASTGHP